MRRGAHFDGCSIVVPLNAYRSGKAIADAADRFLIQADDAFARARARRAAARLPFFVVERIEQGIDRCVEDYLAEREALRVPSVGAAIGPPGSNTA